MYKRENVVYALDPKAKIDYSKLARQADDQIGGIAKRIKLRGTDQSLTMDDLWIEMGWFKRNNKDGSVRLTSARWNEDEQARITAVRYLINHVIRKDPRDITYRDFVGNRLSGLIDKYYSSSPHSAVIEAFPESDIKPWVMAGTPITFYKERENRAAAVNWLIKELGKDPRDITRKDFDDSCLNGLLAHHYNGSPYSAIAEAFPELHIKPWEMEKTPSGIFNEKENRVNAVKWLVERLRKDPRELTYRDFKNNRLVGLVDDYYGSSPYNAVFEAYPEQNIKSWEMTHHMHFKQKKIA